MGAGVPAPPGGGAPPKGSYKVVIHMTRAQIARMRGWLVEVREIKRVTDRGDAVSGSAGLRLAMTALPLAEECNANIEEPEAGESAAAIEAEYVGR